jgi:diacylglycerol kinase
MGKRTLKHSFSTAVAGIVYAFFSERNMQIHVLAAMIAVISGYILGIKRLEWGLLLITIFIVLIAEIINTAIEKTVDLVTLNYHPVAKLAKNLAAGAVLLSAVNAVIMAFVIFGPYLF